MRKTRFDKKLKPDLDTIVPIKKATTQGYTEGTATLREVMEPVENQGLRAYVDEVQEAVAGTIEFTLTGQPEEGDFIQIGDEVYPFYTVDGEDVGEGGEGVEGGDGEPESKEGIKIGEELTDTQTNLVDYITEKSKIVTIGTFDLNVVNLTAKVKGELNIGVLADFENEVGSFDGETLKGGKNGIVAPKGAIYFTDTKVYFAIDDCTPTESNFKTIDFED